MSNSATKRLEISLRSWYTGKKTGSKYNESLADVEIFQVPHQNNVKTKYFMWISWAQTQDILL
jgi:hypothetical protein